MKKYLIFILVFIIGISTLIIYTNKGVKEDEPVDVVYTNSYNIDFDNMDDSVCIITRQTEQEVETDDLYSDSGDTDTDNDVDKDVNTDGLFRADRVDSGDDIPVYGVYGWQEVEVDAESEYTDADYSVNTVSNDWSDALVDAEADSDSGDAVSELDGWTYINEPNQWNSTYMGVHKITSVSSPQYQWLQSHDWGYTDEGIVTYDGRILVALTPAFGTIGDYVDLLLADGTVLYCIIGDEKANSDTYGHWGTGGLNVIEIIVSPDWYNGHENKYYPEVVAYR